MVYKIEFAEKGHAWYAYKGICNSYRATGKSDVVTAIKISGSTITVPTEDAKDKIVSLAQKCKARGVTIDKLV